MSLPQSTILYVRDYVEANCDSNPATKFQKNLEKGLAGHWRASEPRCCGIWCRAPGIGLSVGRSVRAAHANVLRPRAEAPKPAVPLELD